MQRESAASPLPSGVCTTSTHLAERLYINIHYLLNKLAMASLNHATNSFEYHDTLNAQQWMWFEAFAASPEASRMLIQSLGTHWVAKGGRRARNIYGTS